jgi:hypothetical protein
MKFEKVSQLSKKRFNISRSVKEQLEKYVEYQNSLNGGGLTESDIVSTVLMKFDRRIKFPATEEKTAFAVQITTPAEDALDQIKRDRSVSEDIIVERGLAKLLQDSQFRKWCKSDRVNQ